MTKITRPDINVQGFASSPQSQERTTFGTETESTNLADFLTPEFLRGWGVLPVGGKPPYQWFNGAVYLISQLQAMQFQQGVPEHVASQEFHRNGLTSKNGVLYRSKTDSNTGNDPETDSTNWQPQTAMVPGTKDVSDIDANGVLKLTVDDGKYITLTGHGAADVEITGFGDQLPVGYEFELIIPRTLPDTGNTANTLGNFVQFTHTAGVDGIDMTMNKRVIDGTVFFNYQSYPNASGTDGDACNLDERVKFVQTSQLNGGRAAFVGLPKAAFGRVDDGGGNYSLWERAAKNRQELTLYRQISSGSGDVSVIRETWHFPMRFESIAPVCTGSALRVWQQDVGDGSAIVTGDPSGSPNSGSNQTDMQLKVVKIDGFMEQVRVHAIAIGEWKPVV